MNTAEVIDFLSVANCSGTARRGDGVLGAHMLEICPSIASDRPTAEIHPLSIGGKADPVRLVFTASQGPAVDLQRPRLGREPAESTLPKSYWRWTELLENNERGFFPYTPATNLLYGLREALRMLHEEGLPQVFARHARLAEATRRAVGDVGARDDAARPGGIQHVLTAVQMPDGFDERDLRKLVLERFNLSLGAGLGKLAGRAFRIGRLGDFNELMLEGTLSGVEMGLALSGIPHNGGGVTAALRYQTEQAPAYGSA